MKFTEKNSFTKEELQLCSNGKLFHENDGKLPSSNMLMLDRITSISGDQGNYSNGLIEAELDICLLYTSPSPRDWMVSRMPSSA